jgi:hypothetical protein
MKVMSSIGVDIYVGLRNILANCNSRDAAC